MIYNIKFEKKALKQFSNLDKNIQIKIKKWIDKNLYKNNNPRFLGKSLKGNFSEYWRYRVGDYRIITKIKDDELLILVIEIGHRKEIYKNK